MSEQQMAGQGSGSAQQDDNQSALFAQLVMQQTNLALMLLGKVAHPESGQTYKDIDGARQFIDQLEMLEAKTKGNLSKEESSLLKQSLMNLRLAFVQAVESDEPQKEQAAPQPASTPSSGQAGTGSESAPGAASQTEEEHRKKFSKKY